LRVAALVAALGALCATCAAGQPVPTPGPLAPCRVAKVKLLTTLDSAQNVPGDWFSFVLVGNAEAREGLPEIPDGTRGYGIVAYVDRPDFGGRPGRLIVEPRYLVLADGSHLQVTVDPERSEGFAQGKTRNLESALQFVPGMGLVVNGYNALHHGTQVQLGRGTLFRVILGDALATGDCYLARPRPSPEPTPSG
jgi:hypothetical protein